MLDNPFTVIDRRIDRLEALLIEIRDIVSNSHSVFDEMGGIELAQQVTRLSKARIYTLVSLREIPHKKKGNRLAFSRTELIAWLEAGNRIQKRG
jgi:predicted DNA-binding transcriptional regulator AlpA